MVMYAGQPVEYGDVETLFHRPQHPYTRGLLNSLIRLSDHRETRLKPIPGNAAPTCLTCRRAVASAPAAPMRWSAAKNEAPALRTGPDGHPVACHHVDEAHGLPDGGGP